CLVDGGYRRERRPLAQARFERLKRHIVGLGDHLDATVGQVADEPGDTKRLGGVEREITESHALHAPTHEVLVTGHPREAIPKARPRKIKTGTTRRPPPR